MKGIIGLLAMLLIFLGVFVHWSWAIDERFSMKVGIGVFVVVLIALVALLA